MNAGWLAPEPVLLTPPRQSLTLPTPLTTRKRTLCLSYSESQEVRVRACTALHWALYVDAKTGPKRHTGGTVRPRRPRPTLPLCGTLGPTAPRLFRSREGMKQTKNSLKHSNLEQKTHRVRGQGRTGETQKRPLGLCPSPKDNKQAWGQPL